MLREFIEQQFNNILGQNISPFDKSLKFFVWIIYIITFLTTISKFGKYINLATEFLYQNIELGIKEDMSLLIILSLLFVAVYYLLLEISNILRRITSSIINDVFYLYAYLSVKKFNDYHQSEISKKYKYDRNIVFKYQVEEYLEKNKDERIQKKLENHDKWVNDLFIRKRNLMLISILLAVNFFLHQKAFEQFTGLYWLVVITIIVCASIFPDDNLMFMYIKNNNIRE